MSCRRCGQFGHYARDCPSGFEGGSGGYGGRSGGSGGSGGGGSGCYICGGRHFARECPNNREGQGRLCYSCQQPGHYADNCPNRGGGGGGYQRSGGYGFGGGSRDEGRSGYYRQGEDVSSRPNFASEANRTGSAGAAPTSIVASASPHDPTTAWSYIQEQQQKEAGEAGETPAIGEGQEVPVEESRGAEESSRFASSFSRPAASNISCFKCGGPHFARECPSNVDDGNGAVGRICYNCKQPGHVSSNCPLGGGERTSRGDGGGCYNCGGPHFARDCPEEKGSRGGGDKGTCFVCGKPGHFAGSCPYKSQDERRGGGGGCYHCGGRHFARECPELDRAGGGYGAGGYGRSGGGSYGGRFGGGGYGGRSGGGYGAGGGECYICKGRHFARECPQRDSAGGGGGAGCYNCGRPGHFARECPERTEYRHGGSEDDLHRISPSSSPSAAGYPPHEGYEEDHHHRRGAASATAAEGGADE